MNSWKPVAVEGEGNEGIERMYRHACVRRGLREGVRKLYKIESARSKTDGYTTLVVVTMREVLWPGDTGGRVIYGYGMSVRAFGDKFREELGINRALRRAFECAATVILHKSPR